MVLWDFFLFLSLWTGVSSLCPGSSCQWLFSILLLSGFSFSSSQQDHFAKGVFSCVWRVSGIVCSEKHLQTIIGKCVKPAINLLYWHGSLSGSLSRIDFSPRELVTEKAEPLKRPSQKEADSRRGKWQGENRGVEAEPEVLRQSLWWKNISSWDVQKESWLSQKFLQKRNF